jgi:hypothetical protein
LLVLRGAWCASSTNNRRHLDNRFRGSRLKSKPPFDKMY